MKKQIITLAGFHCEACTRLSLKRLQKVPGVVSVIATESEGVFEVEARHLLTPDEVEPLFEETEYTVTSIT